MKHQDSTAAPHHAAGAGGQL
ncbi:unnamed protein product [Ophioblennius macclurei]